MIGSLDDPGVLLDLGCSQSIGIELSANGTSIVLGVTGSLAVCGNSLGLLKAILASGYSLAAAVVALVVKGILVLTCADCFLTSVITDVVIVAVFMQAVKLGASVVTLMVKVGIFAFSDKLGATVIAKVILAGVLMNSVHLVTSVVTSMVIVCVCAFTDRYGTTVITNMVLIGILVGSVVLAAAVVTLVILICVNTLTYKLAAFVFTNVVLVLILVRDCGNLTVSKLPSVDICNQIGSGCIDIALAAMRTLIISLPTVNFALCLLSSLFLCLTLVSNSDRCLEYGISLIGITGCTGENRRSKA